MPAAMEIDAAIEALGDALAEQGFERPRPPSADPLVEVRAAVAPLRLPAELERFWQLVDPATIRAEPFPGFTTPAWAIKSWHMQREQFPHREPHNLLLVGYQSWVCMWIELDDEQHGGTLFEGALDYDRFYRRHNRLGDWLEHVAALIDAGRGERREGSNGPYLLVQDPHDDLPRAQRPGPPPHPFYGDQVEFPRDTLSWPTHWQLASGIDPAAAEPRGATHTIGDVLASDPQREFRATVVGRVIDLAGFSGGTRVRVTDGTGEIDIGCAGETTAFGIAITQHFEFDITIATGEREVPADVDAARAAGGDPVKRLTRVLLARYGGRVGATATAVRPLDGAP